MPGVDAFVFKSKQLLGKRSCKKGDVILRSEAFIYVINYKCRGLYCDNCLTNGDRYIMRSCKNCTYSWYCSEKCEIEAKELHGIECPLINRVPSDIGVSSYVRLMLRLIIRLKNGGDTYAEHYTPTKTRKFKDLMNHYRDIKGDEVRMKDVRSIMKTLGTMIGPQNVPSEVDFIGLYGRVLVNRFCLMDDLLCPIGSTVFLAGSVFDHSCKPNAYPSFEGKKLVVRSLVDWAELDITKVNISYVDVVCTAQERRKELQKNWYFWCECPHCNDKERKVFENSITCENPECRAPVQLPERTVLSAFNPNPAIEQKPECEVCGWEIESKTLETYQSVVSYTRQRLKSMKEECPSVEVCQNILEKQGNLFSTMNVWRVRTIDFIFNAAFNKLICLSAMEYGYKNLDAMKYYYGLDHPTLGLFYMKMAKVCMYIRQFKEGLKFVEEAKKILTLGLGPDHRLITDACLKLYIIASEDLDIMMERRLKKSAEKERIRKESLVYNPFESLFAIQIT